MNKRLVFQCSPLIFAWSFSFQCDSIWCIFCFDSEDKIRWQKNRKKYVMRKNSIMVLIKLKIYVTSELLIQSKIYLTGELSLVAYRTHLYFLVVFIWIVSYKKNVHQKCCNTICHENNYIHGFDMIKNTSNQNNIFRTYRTWFEVLAEFVWSRKKKETNFILKFNMSKINIVE